MSGRIAAIIVANPAAFRDVTNDFPPLDAGVVVLINQQRLDDDENLVHVGADQVVELVQDRGPPPSPASAAPGPPDVGDISKRQDLVEQTAPRRTLRRFDPSAGASADLALLRRPVLHFRSSRRMILRSFALLRSVERVLVARCFEQRRKVLARPPASSPAAPPGSRATSNACPRSSSGMLVQTPGGLRRPCDRRSP